MCHPLGGCGIWFQHDGTPPTASLQLLCLWVWGLFFWSAPASSCWWLLTASCDFSALAAGYEHTSFYSAILNQSLLTCLCWSVVSISVLFTNFLQCYSDIFCVSVTQGPVGDLSGQLPSKFSSQSSRCVIGMKSTHVQLRDWAHMFIHSNFMGSLPQSCSSPVSPNSLPGPLFLPFGWKPRAFISLMCYACLTIGSTLRAK